LLEAGERGAPLALCLHGFPDSAWTWRHLLPALADAGFRAVAPFLRGYAPSGLARDDRYAIGELAGDALALEELFGNGSTVLVGHDWGAAVVYGALHEAPARFRAAVAVSVPPAGGFSIDAVSPAQLRRSWYSLLFQLPDISVPEAFAAANDLAVIDGLWADWSPGFEAPEDIARAKEALRPPGHLRAALTYYRHAPTALPTEAEAEASRAWQRGLEVPLLYIHGARDGCIGLDSVEILRPYFPPSAEVAVLDDVGHFVQLEQPKTLNRLVLDFLTRAHRSQ
jgi:pimeloyl-ACP methyl ester carboxylesterase